MRQKKDLTQKSKEVIDKPPKIDLNQILKELKDWKPRVPLTFYLASRKAIRNGR